MDDLILHCLVKSLAVACRACAAQPLSHPLVHASSTYIPTTWCTRLATWPPLRSLSLHLCVDSSIKTQLRSFTLSHTAAAMQEAALAVEHVHAHAMANPALSRLALTPPHRPILLHAISTIKGPPPSILSAIVTVSLSAPVSRRHAPLFFSTTATMNSSPHALSLLVHRSQWSPWTTSSLRTGWPHHWSTGAAAPHHHASDHPPSSVSHRSASAHLPSCVVACS
jgi:hypothetical protein